MEASRLTQRAFHETTLPFTRYISGHAEYTVTNFGPPPSPDRPARRGDTTAAHQIASAAILTAELLTYSCNPQRALESPACEMIKSIPSMFGQPRWLVFAEAGAATTRAATSPPTTVRSMPASYHADALECSSF